MKPHHLITLLACAAVGCAGTKPLSPTDGPAAAAKAFSAELRERKVDGLPTGANWNALEPRVTAELAAAIRNAQAEQSQFRTKHPDEKPPWIEGDMFGSLFEGPQKFTIGEARVTGDKAEVPVECSYTEGGSPTKWTDTLLMRKTPKGWQIDDVRYGGKWDFAAKGTLRHSLAGGAH